MIVDLHTHIFPPSLRNRPERWLDRDATFAELFAGPRAKMATAEELLEAMDEDSVVLSVAIGIGWTDQVVAREASDYAIDRSAAIPTGWWASRESVRGGERQRPTRRSVAPRRASRVSGSSTRTRRVSTSAR